MWRIRRRFRQPCRQEDTARGTSTDGAYRWLHAKPLYSAIGRVLAPYWPGGRHGHRRRRRPKHNTKLLLYHTLGPFQSLFLSAKLSAPKIFHVICLREIVYEKVGGIKFQYDALISQ